jgi:hypothetical protein
MVRTGIRPGARRLASMAAAPLVLWGCATQAVPVGPAPALGQVSARPGRPGFVVAAPHGTSDTSTAEIAADIAARSGFAVVIATGFSLEPDTREGPGRRYQVNRPVEGVPGRPPAEDVATEDAARVYAAYEARVREAAQGPLRLYVEIHGNNHPDAAQRIEIATVGVDEELALRVKALGELIRDANLRAHADAPRLGFVVEPADVLRYNASGAKQAGILRLPAHALHIELPKVARTEWRAVYTAVLADLVAEASTLPGLQ